MTSTTTTERLSDRRIAAELGIPLADVDKQLTAPEICQLKAFEVPVWQLDGHGKPVKGEDGKRIRIGSKPMDLDTWWGYVGKARRERRAGIVRPSQAPEPDGYLGRTPFWYPVTLALFKLARPGKGKGGGRTSHRDYRPAR